MKKKAVRDNVIDHTSQVVDVRMMCASDAAHVARDIHHFHNSYEVVIVQSGRIDGIVGALSDGIGAGTVVMIGPDLPHGIARLSPDLRAILVHIPHDVLSRHAALNADMAAEAAFMRDSRYGYLFTDSEVAAEAARLATEMAAARGFLRLSLLFSLLHLLSRSTQVRKIMARPDDVPQQSPSPMETPVDRTFRYLYAHFQEDLALDDIARFAHQNPAALCRAFKRKCGCTIFQFVNRLRIEKACQLLQCPDLTVQQVAFMAGFNTFSHFNVQFKCLTGVTPGQYRRRLSDGSE